MKNNKLNVFRPKSNTGFKRYEKTGPFNILICMTILVFAFLFPSNTLAGEVTLPQQTVIKGTVTSATDNTPLVSVTVAVKGTTTGTSTNENGEYAITVPGKDAVLVFRFIGYQTVEVPVEGKSTIDVTMSESAEILDEVIVIAYGTTTRSNLTGAAVALSSETLKDVFTPTLSTMIQSKVAGVYTRSSSGRPGETATVYIRGKGSINTTNSPLWVVDGVMVGHSEPTINPADVEGVTVLKDASATSLYGSQAANGVILIQTKKAEKGKSKLSVNITRGFTELNQGNFSLMNSKELYDYHSSWNEETWFSEDLLNTNTDWVDIATQVGKAQEYNVSYNGGNDQMSTYLSGTYYNESGAINGYDLERYSAIAKVDIKANKRLTIRANLMGHYTKVDDREHSLYNAFTYLPWDDPYKEDGKTLICPVLDTDYTWYGRDQSNYLYDLQYNWGADRSNTFRLNVGGDLKITDWLTFTSMNNITLGFSNYEYYTDPRSTGGWSTNGSVYSSYSFSQSRLTNQLLRFKKSFDKHSLESFIAWEFSDTHYDNNSASGVGIAAGLSVLNATSEAQSVTGSKGESARQSYLFHAQYVYDDKYLATASFNREGSSSFGPNYAYGNFWSVSAGWNMHYESFMKDISWVNILKLTASYGMVGNAPSAFPFLGYYELTGQYAGMPAAKPYQKGNPDITWESTNTTNLGIETRLFDRVTITADVYNRNNSRLLYYVPLPAMTGYSGIWDNIGEINNKGFELTVEPEIIKGRDFSWNVNFNISYNRNRVIALYEGQPITSGQTRIEEGYDMDSWYTRLWYGVNPGNGEPLWEKIIDNGDGTTSVELTNLYSDATLQFTGHKRSPDFTGGLINEFRYRGFSLTANIGFVEGIYLYNSNRELFDSDGSYPTFNNMNLASGWSRWEKPGDLATHPQPIMGGNHDAHKTSSRFMEDASYIRLRNISLAYQLPQDLVRKLSISNLTVSLNADNLVTVSKWSGMDPETGSLYPVSKKYLLGLKVDF